MERKQLLLAPKCVVDEDRARYGTVAEALHAGDARSSSTTYRSHGRCLKEVDMKHSA
jgi:hypothetical protein